jgi:hypothetical protein
VDSFTLPNSISQNANVGHEVKSRAYVNVITNNLIQETGSATASYSIDLPNGGIDTVSGNTIIQGAASQNANIIHFGGEGFPYANSSLTITDNVIINNEPMGAARALLNNTVIPADMTGNVIIGLPNTQISSGPAHLAGNVDGAGNPIGSSNDTILPSNFTVYTDAAAHAVTLSTSSGVQGGDGLLTVNVLAGHVTVLGGRGGVQITEGKGFGGSNYQTAAGSTNTIVALGQNAIASNGTDQITLGVGNGTLQIADNATVQSGSGNNGYSILGTAKVVGGGGADTFGVVAGGSVSVTGAEYFVSATELNAAMQFDVTNGGQRLNFAVTGGSVGLRLSQGIGSVTTGGGVQGAVIRLNAGAFNVFSGAADTIYASGGSDTVILTGAEKVYAGSTKLAVYGRGIGTAATVFGSNGGAVIDGDTGNILYQGGAAASALQQNLSSCTIAGGAGHLTITSPGGRETIIGGSGGISFYDQAGAHVITTAAGSTNDLHLRGASTLLSQGTDAIDAGGASNQAVTVTGSANITNSGGTSQYLIKGRAQIASTGVDKVTVSGGAAATVTSTKGIFLNETGGPITYTDTARGTHVTLTGGSAALTQPTDNTPALITTSAASNIRLNGGTVSVTSNAADSIYGGAGAATVSLYAARSLVQGGAGSMQVQVARNLVGETFIGGSGSALVNNAGSLSLQAGAGNQTLIGALGAATLSGGTGHAYANLQSGTATVIDGAGSLAVTVGSAMSAVDFRFQAGHGGGTEVITGFRNGKDLFDLQGVSISRQSIGGGSTQIYLTDGTHVTLQGVAVTLHG